jgi:hypothetical protein
LHWSNPLDLMECPPPRRQDTKAEYDPWPPISTSSSPSPNEIESGNQELMNPNPLPDFPP